MSLIRRGKLCDYLRSHCISGRGGWSCLGGSIALGFSTVDLGELSGKGNLKSKTYGHIFGSLVLARV